MRESYIAMAMVFLHRVYVNMPGILKGACVSFWCDGVVYVYIYVRIPKKKHINVCVCVWVFCAR